MAGASIPILDRTRWASDANPVQTLDQDSTGPNLLMNHPALPELRLAEEDQTDPAGRFSIAISGDAFIVRRAATADWGSFTNLFSFSSVGAQTITVADAATSTVTAALTLNHDTSGTPANNLGVALDFGVETSTTVDQQAGRIDVSWLDITHATRRSAMALGIINASQALTDVLTLYDDGTNEIARVDDNTRWALGTGADSVMYFDGNDTYWDLQAVGTGGLMIAFGDSAPAPDNDRLHVWEGTAGSIGSASKALMTLESDGSAVINILTGSSSEGGIMVGDAAANNKAELTYDHGNNRWNIRDEGANKIRFTVTSGVNMMEFVTTAGTITGTGTTILSGDFLANAGLRIGVDSTDNLIDDASNGASTAVLYIGNETIDTTASDRRLKEHIIDARSSFVTQRLAELSGYLREYDWKKDSSYAGLHSAGFVAQELHKTLPQFVRVGEGESIWSLHLQHLTPYLVGGWADHEDRVTQLEAHVVELKGKITKLEGRLAKKGASAA